jgi:DNA-directed RNA polymerase specialized sigma24 family protein
MDERECLAQQFETDRTHLRAVACRMLGSVSGADDAVQESWLRLSRSDAANVDKSSAADELLRYTCRSGRGPFVVG